ncbi:MAG: nucleoside-diphosphate kinase [Promicromonosporaceae bacterium]|nr:nucleoside-diphosphate kinase [Promicromonosporaceae bacterium]
MSEEKTHAEKTLVIVKPDGVSRGLVGDVINRIEKKGYRLCQAELGEVTPELARKHYEEHARKPFFGDLVNYLTSGPVMAVVVEGERAVAGMRNLAGPTDPTTAPPGTIRGDLAHTRDGVSMYNVVHTSDSRVSADREIALWFPNLDKVKTVPEQFEAE